MQIKRILAAVLAALCLCSTVLADGGIAPVMEAFIAERGLNESNFSLCYYNTVTGEEYRYNADKMMVAASTFKLPLNMYYYEMEAAGEIASDAYIPDSGTTLDVCHRLSLVHSDNPSSIAMLYHLGSFRTYKEKMRKYFTTSDEDVPYLYWVDNYYSTAMMLDALKYLYEHQEDFPELLGYLKEACPGAYFKRYISDCEIAHKFGSFEGAENDVGIIYAHQPFLLAVYTQSVGENISARAAEAAKAYTDEQYRKQLEEEARQKEAARLAEEQKKAEEQARLEKEQKAAEEAAMLALSQKKTKITVAACVVALALAGLCILLLRRKKVKA